MDGHRETDAGASDDYEHDILAWSRRQGDLLRRIAAGEAVNETLDWDNIAEEIETVGRNEFAGGPLAADQVARALAQSRGMGPVA